MGKRGDPRVLRLVVIFLRSHAQMTQAQFGKECRVDQAQVSRYENGREAPSEEILRRMAKVAGIHRSLVVNLRQFCSSFLASASRGDARSAEKELSLTILEPVLLALLPYLVELGKIENPSANFQKKLAARQARSGKLSSGSRLRDVGSLSTCLSKRRGVGPWRSESATRASGWQLIRWRMLRSWRTWPCPSPSGSLETA